MEDESRPASPAQVSTTGTATATPPKNSRKYLRVMVDGTDPKDGEPIHVNVRLPIRLLRLGVRFASFIPPQAQQQVTEELRRQGMDVDVSRIKPEDLDELIDNLGDLSIDIDRKQDNVKVKIYAEQDEDRTW
jgi:hypothetical protein